MAPRLTRVDPRKAEKEKKNGEGAEAGIFGALTGRFFRPPISYEFRHRGLP